MFEFFGFDERPAEPAEGPPKEGNEARFSLTKPNHARLSVSSMIPSSQMRTFVYSSALNARNRFGPSCVRWRSG